jgi:hypothetical protein
MTGDLETGSNGNPGQGIPPTVTDSDRPGGDFAARGVQVGDRFRFTMGPFAPEDRIVVGGRGRHAGAERHRLREWPPMPAAGIVGESYEIHRPLCLDLSGGGLVACSLQGGPAGTQIPVATGGPESASEGRVTVQQSVASDLTWVRNGLDMVGQELISASDGEDASWNVGGDVGDNFFSPLRSAGDEEIRVLTDGLDPGDFLELQLTPGPAGTCAAGSGCGCFGGGSLGQVQADVTTFVENVVVP